MLNIILLLVGFVALIKGADIFVDASSSIAKKFNIPSIIIGMTIVAMGTSLPELSVSVTSSLVGLNDMSIANVTGSNIFNILIALGVCSTIGKLKISNYKDVITLLFSCIGLLLFALNGTLGVFEGILLLVAFTIYILSMIKQAKDNKEESEDEKQRNIFITVVLGILGATAIVIGGNMVVNSASEIALKLGMSENLVGLTIVALGTSLPEFVTSVMATKKGELEIAIGNIIGSNIFNILLILGVASLISPIAVSVVAICDVMFMVFTVTLFIFLTVKEKELNKKSGILLIMMYIVYLIITIIR
jgi:cation:H+ antiporter